jgi:hypothetical protein
MFMLDLFIISLGLSYALFALFGTDVILHYWKLFKLDRVMFGDLIKDYEEFSKTNPSVFLLDYIYITKNSFLFKLVSCPVCIVFWLSLAICLYININPFNAFVLSFLSLVLFFLLKGLSKL